MNKLAYQEDIRDEMLNGKMVLMSPRPTVNHNQVAFNIAHIFWERLKGRTCRPFGNGTDVFFTTTDRVVPDVMIVCHEDIIKRNGIHGAPDLIVEVLSPGTEKKDRGYKKDLYERSGVREYWLVDPETKTIEVYLLHDGKYTLQDVYKIYPDYVEEGMSDEERSMVKEEIKTSLYDDFTIPLQAIFANLF